MGNSPKAGCGLQVPGNPDGRGAAAGWWRRALLPTRPLSQLRLDRQGWGRASRIVDPRDPVRVLTVLFSPSAAPASGLEAGQATLALQTAEIPRGKSELCDSVN